MKRQIVLDTETTGLSPEHGHRIIEIGCLEMINRRLTGKHFHQYLNPERSIDTGAQAVHGLTNTFLADKPKFRDIYIEFLRFIDGAELVIHNAPFDLGFINHELRLVNHPIHQLETVCEITDTLIIARKTHPGQKNNLDALTKRYKINHFSRDFHGALLDSQILAQVYLAMTGGQESLFANENPTHELSAMEHEPLVRSQDSLLVIAPSAEELALDSSYFD